MLNPDLKRELIFATNNPHKLFEAQNLLSSKVHLLSLNDIGFFEDIPEDYDTLAENARQKVQYIYNRFHVDCFADDTGLEVDALNGKPGVFSARYAGDDKNPKNNIKKLLNELNGISNRKARFRTVVALILNGKEYVFEGIVNGIIVEKERGSDGFGYDPVFQPIYHEKTFAEMPIEVKNQISHRAQAINQLVAFLKDNL